MGWRDSPLAADVARRNVPAPPAIAPRDPAGFAIDTTRPKINNPDGSFSTEKTITVGFDDRYFNIPTIVNGREVSPDEAIKAAQGDLSRYPNFASEPEALGAAKERSARIGEIRGGVDASATPPIGIGAAPRAMQWPTGAGITAPRWKSSPTVADLHSGKARIIDQPYVSIEDNLSERGAPAGVRHAVGGAKTEDDRLATLRKFYPDARPYKDNFIFTSPETGMLTLYNPRRLDAGDFASAIPEAIEGVGAAIGGTLGAVGGAVAGIGGGPPGMLAGGLGGAGAGAGFGGSLAREAEQAIATTIGDRVDTRSTMQRLLDPLVSFGMNAVGQKLGDALAGPATSAMTGPALAARDAARKVIPNRIDEMAGLGIIRPPLGTLTDNRSAKWVEQTVAGMPGGADVIVGSYDDATKALGLAANRLAAKYGGGNVTDIVGAGRAIQDGLKAADERYRAKAGDLYDRAYEIIDENARRNLKGADLGATRAVLGDLEAGLSSAPRSMMESVGPAIKRARNTVGDVKDGNVSFGILRQMRSDLGADIKNPILLGANGSAQPHLERLYEALTADMNGYAKRWGADKAIVRADNYFRSAMERTSRLQKVMDADVPERAYRLAMSASTGKQGGASNLSALRKTVGLDAWSDVSGYALGALGRPIAGESAKEGGDFTTASFLKNWRNLPEDSKNVLFRGTQFEGLVPALNQLTRVAERLEEAQRLAYPAGGQRAGYQLAAGGVMGSIGALATGDVQTGLIIGATMVLAPRTAARLMTNPKFVRTLVAASTNAGEYAGRPLLRVVARMGAIAEAEPALTRDIAAYLDALSKAGEPRQEQELPYAPPVPAKR